MLSKDIIVLVSCSKLSMHQKSYKTYAMGKIKTLLW